MGYNGAKQLEDYYSILLENDRIRVAIIREKSEAYLTEVIKLLVNGIDEEQLDDLKADIEHILYDIIQVHSKVYTSFTDSMSNGEIVLEIMQFDNIFWYLMEDWWGRQYFDNYKDALFAAEHDYYYELEPL